MSNLIIYGASDDLIEVEGVVRDELNPPYDEAATVLVKVGGTVHTRLRVEYSPDGSGEWRIQPTSATPEITIVPARGEDEGDDEHGCPGYSDKAVIDMGSIEAHQINVGVERTDQLIEDDRQKGLR